MTDYNYLNCLIDTVKKVREQVGYRKIDTTKCSITYMPKKKTSYVGYKEGYNDCLIKIQKGMKESEKIRPTVKDYLKFIKNEDGELIKIESYSKGELDCLFQTYWIENVRYLFPFRGDGGYYPTYSYATKYEDEHVIEEYMVDGSQIIYEAYTYKSKTEVDYDRINYVSGGKYPVMEIVKGRFRLEPLGYEEIYSDSWLNHR